ncbi:MAG: DUF4440 domain-containing protein [Blastocatellia bacterium]|nr:MAG: DUF4440 domain-containing protein [Blastocatellia bacterium]
MTEEQAIRNLVKTWMAASAKGDTSTVLTLMDDDVVFLVPGQEPMRGRDAFAKSFEAMSAQNLHMEGHVDFKEIEVIDDWAYCWNQLEVSIRPGNGPAMRREGYTLSILRKRNGKWLLFRDANLLGSPVKEE